MIKPSSSKARRALLKYHDFVDGLGELERLKNTDDIGYESKTQKLERTLGRLRRDFHGRSSLSYFSEGYIFNFKTAESVLRAIKNDKPYSTSDLKGLCKSIPTIKEFVVSASVASA